MLNRFFPRYAHIWFHTIFLFYDKSTTQINVKLNHVHLQWQWKWKRKFYSRSMLCSSNRSGWLLVHMKIRNKSVYSSAMPFYTIFVVRPINQFQWNTNIWLHKTIWMWLFIRVFYFSLCLSLFSIYNLHFNHFISFTLNLVVGVWFYLIQYICSLSVCVCVRILGSFCGVMCDVYCLFFALRFELPSVLICHFSVWRYWDHIHYWIKP